MDDPAKAFWNNLIDGWKAIAPLLIARSFPKDDDDIGWEIFNEQIEEEHLREVFLEENSEEDEPFDESEEDEFSDEDMTDKKSDITERLEEIIRDWDWLHEVDGPTVREVCLEALLTILRRDNQLRIMRRKYEK